MIAIGKILRGSLAAALTVAGTGATYAGGNSYLRLTVAGSPTVEMPLTNRVKGIWHPDRFLLYHDKGLLSFELADFRKIEYTDGSTSGISGTGSPDSPRFDVSGGSLRIEYAGRHKLDIMDSAGRRLYNSEFYDVAEVGFERLGSGVILLCLDGRCVMKFRI